MALSLIVLSDKYTLVDILEQHPDMALRKSFLWSIFNIVQNVIDFPFTGKVQQKNKNETS
jgi:hypothetical protein